MGYMKRCLIYAMISLLLFLLFLHYSSMRYSRTFDEYERAGANLHELQTCTQLVYNMLCTDSNGPSAAILTVAIALCTLLHFCKRNRMIVKVSDFKQPLIPWTDAVTEAS